MRALQQSIEELEDINQDNEHKHQSNKADDILRLVCGGSGPLIIAVTHRSLDIGAGDVDAFLLFLVQRAINLAEFAFTLLFRLVIVYRLIVEHLVLLLSENIEYTHS